MRRWMDFGRPLGLDTQAVDEMCNGLLPNREEHGYRNDQADDENGKCGMGGP